MIHLRRLIPIGVSVVCLLVVPSLTSESEAFRGYYPLIDYRLQNTPTYCITEIHQNDYVNSSDFRNIIQNSINEWTNELVQTYPSEKNIWAIKLKQEIHTESNFPEECDMTIHYKENLSEYPDAIGVFHYSSKLDLPQILISHDVLKEKFEWAEQTTKDRIYESMRPVVLHELGHSFGLGHYFVADWGTMGNYYSFKEIPSIMFPAAVNDVERSAITSLDVDKVYSIYGTFGFLAFSLTDEDTKGIKNFEGPKDIERVFSNVKISTEQIKLKNSDTVYVTVSGNLIKDKMLQNQKVSLIIKKPDQSVDSLEFIPKRNGYFEAMVGFEADSQKGMYVIEPVYLNTIQHDMRLNLEVEPLPKEIISDIPDKTKSIPSWIKNNADWWAEGQIDDNSFVQGIQFMIKEDIISIPNLSKSSSESADSVPAWIKNNAGWWAEGQIDDNSFVKGIEYLVKVGIIKVS
ncbi:MAG: hypothetical protein O3C48_08450 [Crenarchaeota archaeon]|nr:hypothetical protein [Thermoproteota archaeon]